MADGTGPSCQATHSVRSAQAVDALLAEAEAVGGTISRAGAPTPWGGYNGAFTDLDGHAWEVAHNPGWPLAADRSVQLR